MIAIILWFVAFIIGIVKKNDQVQGATGYEIYDVGDSDYRIVETEDQDEITNIVYFAHNILLCACVFRFFKITRLFGGSRLIISVIVEYRKVIVPLKIYPFNTIVLYNKCTL